MDRNGRLSFLPLPDAEPDPDLFIGQILDGWAQAQRASDLSLETIERGRARVLEFLDFTGKFPWQWGPGDADDYYAHARGVRNLSHATLRSYQGMLRRFLAYAIDPVYDWNQNCGRLFGAVMSQIITEWNRIPHSQPSESRPEKRAFTPDELQAVFDLADLEVQRRLASGRVGALAVARDAAAMKTAYGWGLRADELCHLQRVDLGRNGDAPYFGSFGVVRVRWGKAHRGSAKKTRSVLTTWQWAADALKYWVEDGLPLFGEPINYLFPTSRGKILTGAALLRRLRGYLDELGFPPGLDLHSFRRSYVTNLITIEGYPQNFVTMQVGHAHASTTSIYTLPAPEYQRLTLKKMHDRTVSAAESLLKGGKHHEA